MLRLLSSFVHSRGYWFAVLAVGVGIEAVALYYQHVLGEPPCALCIQSRAFVLLGVLFGLLGVVGARLSLLRYAAQLGLIVSLGFLWRVSREAVLVERGLMESTCGMDPGFPSWLPLDQWLPQVFEVWTMCGYTPDFIFGMTMGEGLLYGTVTLFFIAVAALLVQLLTSLGFRRMA